MEREFLLGERDDLVLRECNCPACDAEGAQVIEFPAGKVVRCEACGLLDLQRAPQPEGSPA